MSRTCPTWRSDSLKAKRLWRSAFSVQEPCLSVVDRSVPPASVVSLRTVLRQLKCQFWLRTAGKRRAMRRIQRTAGAGHVAT